MLYLNHGRDSLFVLPKDDTTLTIVKKNSDIIMRLQIKMCTFTPQIGSCPTGAFYNLN